MTRQGLFRSSAWCVVWTLAACGNITRKPNGGVPGDARHDAAVPHDAAIDAMVQPPPTPAREVISGAGHMTGATYTLEVEIGVPFEPQKASSATYTLQPNTAVQP